MAKFRIAVHITPRKGLLDPQGNAVKDALHTLGFKPVRAVHVGRYIVLETEAYDAIAAEETVTDMCRKLLQIRLPKTSRSNRRCLHEASHAAKALPGL